MAKDTSNHNYNTLHRSTTNRVIAGVGGGLGEYLNLDPTIIRIIFIMLTIFGGSGILIYLVLWLIMPSDQSTELDSQGNIKINASEISGKARNFANDLRLGQNKEESRFWIGLIVVIFGFMALFHNFGLFEIFSIGKLWPILLVVFGIMILTRQKK